MHRCQCCLPHVARNLQRSPAQIRKANRCTSLLSVGKTIMFLPLHKQVAMQRVHWCTCNKHLQKKVQLHELQRKILQRSRKWNAMQKSLPRKQKRFCQKWWLTVEETQLPLQLRKVSKHSTPAQWRQWLMPQSLSRPMHGRSIAPAKKKPWVHLWARS